MRRFAVALSRSLGLFHRIRRGKLWFYRFLPQVLRDDRDELNFYRQFVAKGDLVFDVGANVGIKTKTFRGLGARVLSVEPQTDALEELRQAFGNDPSVTIVPTALAASEGRASLYSGQGYSGLSTMSRRWMSEGRYSDMETWLAGQEVQTTTLDRLIERFGEPLLIKIDVEGFELQVLKGLSRPLPFISFEFHSELMDEAVKCVRRLESLGISEFNCVLSEGSGFELDEWCSSEDLILWLKELKDPLVEGEIYGRCLAELESHTEPRGEELLDRYRAVYGIEASAPLTEEMVLRHWNLERALTRELLTSTPEERREVFQSAYSRLYSELPWLNEWSHTEEVDPDLRFGDWIMYVGAPPRRVYEVGSGRGELIGYLAARDYQCKGSEITSERGERWSSQSANLAWGVTDGVHLDRFENPGSFDVIISDQVIEHLHPDDLIEHMKGALSLLAPGGRYVFSTPHALFGPMDVTRIFGYDTPQGMHLKEYTYRELVAALKGAGFDEAYAVLKLPKKLRAKIGGPSPRLSKLYLRWLMVLESLLGRLPTQPLRRRAARAGRLLMFQGILLVGLKSPARLEITSHDEQKI